MYFFIPPFVNVICLRLFEYGVLSHSHEVHTYEI